MEVLNRPDISPYLKSFDFTIFSKLPNNCFHLGDGMFVMVCLNDNHINVIFSQHAKTTANELAATENEMILPASMWISLSLAINNPEFVDLPNFYDAFSVVNNELFLAVVDKDEEKCISMQKCVLHPDCSREFVEGVCIISEYQWSRLKEISEDISECVIKFILKHALPLQIEQCIEKLELPPYDFNLDKIECEILLTSSLCEKIEEFLCEGIHAVFKCEGCLRQYGNQEGHACVMLSKEEILNKYFNLSISKMDLIQFATSFVSQNLGMVQFLTPEFFESINVIPLMDCIRDLYLK